MTRAERNIQTTEGTVPTEDGASLRTIRQGAGPALVLCHGGPGLWDHRGPLASIVDDAFDVWRYDQRGCGGSGGVEGPYTIGRSVADLGCVQAAIPEERSILGGHSWGATLAMLYATAHPDASEGSSTSAAPGSSGRAGSPPITPNESDASRAIHATPQLAQQQDLDPDEERELLAIHWATDHADNQRGLAFAQAMALGGVVDRRCNASLNAEMNSLDPEVLRERCSRLTVPVLVIQGTHDPRPREALGSLVSALPNVERVAIQGSGHYPWLEAVGPFEQLVRRWLTAL